MSFYILVNLEAANSPTISNCAQSKKGKSLKNNKQRKQSFKYALILKDSIQCRGSDFTVILTI
jgi:hypothetical protein